MAAKRARTEDNVEDLIAEVAERRKISNDFAASFLHKSVVHIEEDMHKFNKKGRRWYVASIDHDCSDVVERVCKELVNIYKAKGYKVEALTTTKFKIIWDFE